MISTVNAKQLDSWLAALADPTRRRIAEMLSDEPRPAGEIHRAFPIAAPAVSRHLRVLREAGLISERPVPDDRRVRLYALEPRPVNELSDWLRQLGQGWQSRLDAFQGYVAVRKQPPQEER